MRCFQCSRTGFTSDELVAHASKFKHDPRNPTDPRWHESGREISATPVPTPQLDKAGLIGLLKQLSPKDLEAVGLQAVNP